MLLGKTPGGTYKLSREAILTAELPSKFTTRVNWRGSLPRDILSMFCRQHRLSEPVFSIISHSFKILTESSESSFKAADLGIDSSKAEKIANKVTYHRMKEALVQLSKGVHKGPASDLIHVLFRERQPTVSKKDVSFTSINRNLDHSQKNAISKALWSKNVFFATDVAEIILK
ncbi:hypothetical protein KIW84_015699 [Lathyrus oleraceus]|uniref:HEN1 double-stranded RNA binding domain-containing protein n=1 Tax=Pisum sativum TaxID=3888 RepID=A0A9D5BRW0_PEA|nr:hypothetical protein KIW84_015699 [Pisum sativum]